MNRGLLTWVVLLALTAACGGGGGPEFTRADADAIRKISQDFAAAYNQKDAAKVSSFFSSSGVLMPPNSSTLRGGESLQSYYETRFREGATDLGVEISDVGGHGPLAFVSGTYSLRVVQAEGDRRDRGKFIWIVRNMGGNWRVEYQIWSSDLPPPAPAPTS